MENLKISLNQIQRREIPLICRELAFNQETKIQEIEEEIQF